MFVSFHPQGDRFVAFLAVDDVLDSCKDPESLLQRAASVYINWLSKMRAIVAEIDAYRKSRRLLSARRVWHLGDAVFGMRSELTRLSLEVDDLYAHLVRDLGVKRKWLEKVIILRRYIPDPNMIPDSLNWGRCEKGTRRVAQELAKGSNRRL